MRWKQSLSVAVLGVALVAAACGGDNKGSSGATTTAGAATTSIGAGGPSAGGTTKIAVGEIAAPKSLDISQDSGAAIPQALLYNVYETLVKIDDQGKFQPLLAKDYKVSSDGLTYTFTLNPGIVFANGDPLTSDTVKQSFDYNATNTKAPALIKATFAPVASVTAPDPTTVVATLKQPSRDFLFNVAQTGGVVVDPASRADLATKTNGSGPFTVTNYTTNASLTLAANAKYWGKKPALTDVVFRYYSDANALANGLKAGDIQITDNLPPELFAPFKSDTANYETITGTTSGEVILAMNNARTPLNNAKVRQAITYAINKKDVNDIAEQGLARIIGSHASPNDPWFKDLSNTYPYSVDKAKSLLQDAGVSNVNLTLDVITGFPYAEAVAPVVKDQLGKVGINVTLKPVQFSLWLDKDFTKGDFDLTIVAHVEARDTNLYGNPDYYWHYNSPQVQQLLKQADAATDEAKSNQLYGQVLDQINADAVNDWLFLLPRLEVVKKGITGYPTGSHSLSYDVTGIR
ncbi:MAG TPA: ABC transporter substrate-binding protein [Acidimicrobiales bacterium]|nr:ABC transporter substrate-binding protein [Acidimicrobiales bacterium]